MMSDFKLPHLYSSDQSLVASSIACLPPTGGNVSAVCVCVCVSVCLFGLQFLKQLTS